MGDLEINELDNIISFADTMAVKLAKRTKKQLLELGKQKKDQYLEKKEKLRKEFKKKKQIL